MPFHVGQKVVCVDAKPRGLPKRKDGTELPHLNIVTYLREGAVYTVRELDTRLHKSDDGAPLRLEEIQCPVVQVRGIGDWELGFAVDRFRPLHTTNIDVFKRMLEPVE